MTAIRTQSGASAYDLFEPIFYCRIIKQLLQVLRRRHPTKRSTVARAFFRMATVAKMRHTISKWKQQPVIDAE